MELKTLLGMYRDESKAVLEDLSLADIELLTQKIIIAWENGNNIFLLGNGGNAAFCANWATDLNLHPFVSEDKDTPLNVDKRLRVFNLSTDPTTITGILNDLGGDNIFVEQLKYLSKPGDLIIGLSGSGNSENIRRAFAFGMENDMYNILLTRNEVGKIHLLSDFILYIRCNSEFPGQTGKNLGNFHYEDTLSKISHMTTGILKQVVYDRSK